MKTKDILPFEVKQWLILGGKLVTRILEDTDRGISQDGNGTKFPPYSSEYAQKKAIGKAGPKGVSNNRQTSPPNLRLTGAMLNSLKAQKPTSSSVELNYREGKKFEGNAKGKKRRNVYGLNNKNEEFVKDFFDKEIDDRIIKFSKKDIIIDLKL
jgi:hypothetical protein